MNFKPIGYFEKEEIAILSERFRSEIVKTQKFEVMERGELEILDRELALQLSDGFDANVVAQAGLKKGAKYVIVGSIGKFGKNWTIDVKMVDCQTSQIRTSITEDYSGNKEGLIKVMTKIANKLAGIEEKKGTWKWITAGTVAVGTAVVIAILKGQQPVEEGLPLPPNPPSH